MTIKGFDNYIHNQNLYLELQIVEAAGSRVQDTSKYHANGDIIGASWLHLPAENKWCLDFDPTIPSYVEIPAAYTQLDFTAGDFSAIMRVNLDDIAAQRQLFCRGLWQVDGYYWAIWVGGTVGFGTWQVGAQQESQSAAGAVAAGNWHTLGISRDGASIRLYRDGVDITNTPAAHINPVTCARAARVGIYDDLVSNPIDGKVEFFRVFGGVALSEAEHRWWHRRLIGA